MVVNEGRYDVIRSMDKRRNARAKSAVVLVMMRQVVLGDELWVIGEFSKSNGKSERMRRRRRANRLSSP